MSFGPGAPGLIVDRLGHSRGRSHHRPRFTDERTVATTVMPRIGVQIHRGTNGAPLDFQELAGLVRSIAAAGLQSAWLTQGFDHDCLTTLAGIGLLVPGIELGTAVVPLIVHHPVALALQVRTVQDIVGGRLCLGLGTSHRDVIEGAYGLDFSHPVQQVERFLSVLDPLVGGMPVMRTDSSLGIEVTLSGGVPGKPQVLLAAMGPRMVEVAGRMADGVITAQVGPRMLGESIVPQLVASAAGEMRPTPRVVVCVPVSLSDDPAGARQQAAAEYRTAAQAEIYRRNFAVEGVDGAADLAIVGTERDIVAGIERLVDAGATDIAARVVGDPEARIRTMAFLASLSSIDDRTGASG